MPSPQRDSQAPAAQRGSIWQSAEQPSNGSWLPSSQLSPPWVTVSPQVVETINGQLAAFGAFKEILAGHTTGGPL